MYITITAEYELYSLVAKYQQMLQTSSHCCHLQTITNQNFELRQVNVAL